MFHDFLGTKAAKTSVIQGEASVGASSGGDIASVSDLVSAETQAGNHQKRPRLHGFNSDVFGSADNKGNRTDAIFVGHDSLDCSPRSTKMLGDGVEWFRRSKNDETLLGVHKMRPLSFTPPLNLSTSSRTTNASKVMNGCPGVQFSLHGAQFVPSRNKFSPHMPNGRHDAASSVPQTAGDEGSGTGTLNCINASSIFTVANPSGLPSGSGSKPPTHVNEQESCTPRRQMTIFYGGQAHVFDEVHPNKADRIMTLAGTNGGPWSTMCAPAPRSRIKAINGNHSRGEESGCDNSPPKSGFNCLMNILSASSDPETDSKGPEDRGNWLGVAATGET